MTGLLNDHNHHLGNDDAETGDERPMKGGGGIVLRSEKYVQAHDFVEMSITSYLNHSAEIESIFETIKQLTELLDIEKTVTIIFENKMASLIHQIVPLL